MMANHEVRTKQAGISSQDVLIPWKLYPVDPRPTSPTIPGLGPDLIPVTLSDTSYMELRSIVSKINSDKNSPTPPKNDDAQNKQEQSPKDSKNESKVGTEDNTTQLIKLMRHFPHIYDPNDGYYKNTKRKDMSWDVISQSVGMSVEDVQAKWKLLRAKYSREKKHLADGDRVSDKTMQFLSSMNFLTYKKRAGTTKRRKISEDSSSSAPIVKPNSIKSQSSSRNALEAEPPDTRSSSHSNISSKIQGKTAPLYGSQTISDQIFADGITLELRRFSPHQKNLIKAKIWQVIADHGKPVQNFKHRNI